MYCGKCGKKIPENSKFCGFCGNEIADFIVQKLPKEEVTKRSKKKSRSRKGIWGLVVIVLIIAIIFMKCKANIDGPHIDRNFIETFPFTSESVSAIENWVARNKDYKIKEIVQNNSQVKILYKFNDAWRIEACNEVYGVDGFCVDLFFSLDFFNSIGLESVYETIYESVVTDLADICGSPVDIRGNGDVYEFYYRGLTITVILNPDSVWIRMMNRLA